MGNLSPNDCNYFDERLASLEACEMQWLERIRSEGKTLGKSKEFPYDVAEGLGLGKSAEMTLKRRIPDVSSETYRNLLEEFQAMHDNFSDLMREVSQVDGDVSLSTLVFVRAYDPRETINANTCKDILESTKRKFPYIGLYNVQKTLTFEDLSRSILSDFMSKLDPSIYSSWVNPCVIRVRKDGKIIRDDTDMQTIDGEILCVAPSMEQYSFDEYINYERFKKRFTIVPATFPDARIVRYVKFGGQYTIEEENDFENNECRYSNFSLEISTQSSLNTLYMEVSRLLGIHWTYVRLRICLLKQVVNLPNNAESKVLLALHDMPILEKFHTHIISKGHSCLAYSILPVPWLDELTGRKLKGRLVEITLDGILSSMYTKKVTSSSLLKPRTSAEMLHIGRSDIKRSKTEELNEFIATSGDKMAEYELAVTRDVVTPYSIFSRSSLCLFVPEASTIADLNRYIREALDIPLIEELDEEDVDVNDEQAKLVWVDENDNNKNISDMYVMPTSSNMSSGGYRPFSSELKRYTGNTLMITVGKHWRTRRICISSDIVAAVIQKSWLEQVMPTEETVQAQLLSREEKLLMINNLHPGRSSSFIAVFNFQMHGSYGKPVEYLDNFGPFITYITEDDTIDCFKERISTISDEYNESSYQKYKLAFFRDKGPPVFVDEDSNTMTSVDSDSDEVTSSTSLSSQFVKAYPCWESTVSTMRKNLSSVENLIIMDGSIPAVGIQRYFQVDGRVNGRVANAIKIA